MTDIIRNDGDEEEEGKKLPYSYFEANVPQKIHHFYISESIGKPERYIDMIHRIKTASPNDTIYLYLNTPGGHVDTGVQIISAMRASAAHVVTVLEGEVCSLGTLIFLNGDEFIVHDDCLFMIHNFSGGTYGKGHEQKAQLDATIKWFTKLASKTYHGFLTPVEFDKMIEGTDYWFDSEDVRKRLTKMVTYQEKQRKAQERKAKK